MAFPKTASVLFAHVIFMVTCTVCFAEVYRVGDDAGWSTNVNYTAWAYPKEFHLDDVVVFVYDNKISNVIQLADRKSYHECDTGKALATYSSGNDAVKIVKRGHNFFVSAVNNKCDPMQKVDINVQRNHSGAGKPAPAPVPTPVENPAPSPNKAGAPARVFGYFSLFGVIAGALMVL